MAGSLGHRYVLGSLKKPVLISMVAYIASHIRRGTETGEIAIDSSENRSEEQIRGHVGGYVEVLQCTRSIGAGGIEFQPELRNDNSGLSCADASILRHFVFMLHVDSNSPAPSCS